MTEQEAHCSEAHPLLLHIRDATVLKGTGRDTVLDGLSVEIRSGEHTAILGANGSGKSSLIKLITQEYRPLAAPDGEPVVQVFGRDRWDVFELRSMLGVVSPDYQQTFIERNGGPVLRGMDVVLSGFFASHGVHAHHRVTASMRERAREALRFMEALDLASKSMGEMSTGEARRILIARTLVSEPQALLLDEPTGGLDIVARHRFLEAVRGLARMGKTIVMVTHRLEEVIPEIEQVVLLRDGRVLHAGPKHEVLTDANLSGAFGAPLHIEETGDGYYTVRMSGVESGL
jgi:iron complex transport system ATP-binding protein